MSYRGGQIEKFLVSYNFLCFYKQKRWSVSFLTFNWLVLAFMCFNVFQSFPTILTVVILVSKSAIRFILMGVMHWEVNFCVVFFFFLFFFLSCTCNLYNLWLAALRWFKNLECYVCVFYLIIFIDCTTFNEY